ncbi:MAG: hypothetical protein ACTS5I_05560 [Rhodanobacter sp.]
MLAHEFASRETTLVVGAQAYAVISWSERQGDRVRLADEHTVFRARRMT